jgi:hypothetical protein
MTEYKITCQDTPADSIQAVGGSPFTDGLVAFYTGGCDSVYATPDDARTFARDILALADEVDGGEVPEAAATVKVGDVVRVVKDDLHIRTGEFVGAVGTVHLIHGGGSTLPYRLAFDDDQDVPYPTWNVAEVEPATEPTPDEPLADWERELLADKPTLVTVKVGDSVNILRPESVLPEYRGVVGVLTRIDDTECKYRVQVGTQEDDNIVWAYEVEPAASTVAATPVPSRALRLGQASTMMGDQPYSAYDLIALADYLAGDNA